MVETSMNCSEFPKNPILVLPASALLLSPWLELQNSQKNPKIPKAIPAFPRAFQNSQCNTSSSWLHSLTLHAFWSGNSQFVRSGIPSLTSQEFPVWPVENSQFYQLGIPTLTSLEFPVLPVWNSQFAQSRIPSFTR